MNDTYRTVADIHHVLRQKVTAFNKLMETSEMLSALADGHHNVERMAACIDDRQVYIDHINEIDRNIDRGQTAITQTLSMASPEEREALKAVVDTIAKKAAAVFHINRIIEEKIASAQNDLRRHLLTIADSRTAISKQGNRSAKARFLDVML